MARLSQEDLDLLTEEERAGIEEDEDGADEDDGGDDAADAPAAAAAEGAKQDDGGEDPDAKDASDAEPAPEAVAAAAAGAAAAADPVAEPEEPQPAAEAAPSLPDRKPSWILDPEVDTKIKDLEAQRAALEEKFDDGELTAKELRQQLTPIDDQLDDMKGRKLRAAIARENAVDKWRDESVPAFLAEHPQYAPGGVLNSVLDQEVRRLQVNAVNPLDPKLLKTAHDNIAAQLEKHYGTKPAAGGKENADKAADSRPAPKRTVVPSLAHVPAADISDTDDGGEFAYLDRLQDKDSVAFEKELAKLSPEATDRYLAR